MDLGVGPRQLSSGQQVRWVRAFLRFRGESVLRVCCFVLPLCFGALGDGAPPGLRAAPGRGQGLFLTMLP